MDSRLRGNDKQQIFSVYQCKSVSKRIYVEKTKPISRPLAGNPKSESRNPKPWSPRTLRKES